MLFRVSDLGSFVKNSRRVVHVGESPGTRWDPVAWSDITKYFFESWMIHYDKPDWGNGNVINPYIFIVFGFPIWDGPP